MNPKFYKEQARAALNEKQKIFALSTLIIFLFSVPSLASRLADLNNPMLTFFLFVIETVISICLISVLQYSFSKMALNALHNENVEIPQLFDGFKIYGKVICKSLIELLLVCIGMLFFIIPGIILEYSLAMSDFILADNPDLSASEAVEKSHEMMKGHRLELFELDLSFAGWFLLTICTLGLLDLWVTPYHRISRAAFYKSLRPETPIEENADNYNGQEAVSDLGSYQQLHIDESPNDPVGFGLDQPEILSPESTNEE